MVKCMILSGLHIYFFFSPLFFFFKLMDTGRIGICECDCAQSQESRHDDLCSVLPRPLFLCYQCWGQRTRDLARAFTTSWQSLSSLIFNYLQGQSQDITNALRVVCVSLYSEITVKT